jgi:hypothetical protein
MRLRHPYDTMRAYMLRSFEPGNWPGDSYAAHVHITPWMGRIGRSTLLRFRAALLLLGTIASALAPTFAWLSLARLLTGIGAAFIFTICVAAVLTREIGATPRASSNDCQALSLCAPAVSTTSVVLISESCRTIGNFPRDDADLLMRLASVVIHLTTPQWY